MYTKVIKEFYLLPIDSTYFGIKNAGVSTMRCIGLKWESSDMELVHVYYVLSDGNPMKEYTIGVMLIMLILLIILHLHY